jgi:hypothetical protein
MVQMYTAFFKWYNSFHSLLNLQVIESDNGELKDILVYISCAICYSKFIKTNELYFMLLLVYA